MTYCWPVQYHRFFMATHRNVRETETFLSNSFTFCIITEVELNTGRKKESLFLYAKCLNWDRSHCLVFINTNAQLNQVNVKIHKAKPSIIELFLRQLVRMQMHKSLQARKFHLGGKGSRCGSFCRWQPDSRQARRCPEGTHTVPLRVLPRSYVQDKPLHACWFNLLPI